MKLAFAAAALLAPLVAATPVLRAQETTTRLLHQPTVSATSVAFEYGGDLWVVPRDGGEARRLTSSEGVETDPHFSPDGRWLAFTGQYDGGADVYVMPAAGGEPKRLTWHPGADQARGWTPEGRVVFVSPRTGMPDGEPQLWTVGVDGGLPERLPLPRAQAGSLSPDGGSLAYQLVRPWETEMRNYRGGQNQPIRVIDLRTHAMRKLPWTDSRDRDPAWLGATIYFISDRDWTPNVWSYDTASGALSQVTHYDGFEVESLDAGAGAVVYEQAGDIHVYDPASGRDRKLAIHAAGDFPWAMPHAIEVGRSLREPRLSPTGVRALFEGRGDIFTVPEDKGTWRNLTRTPGVADRAPIWSPDGRSIAWFSDASGEYRLEVAPQDGTGSAREYTLAEPSYFYDPAWSPDGKRILFTDAEMHLRMVDLASGRETRVDTGNYTWPDRTMYPTWSPDSHWIAYTKRLPGSQFHAVFVYRVADGSTHQLTDGLSDVISPAWGASGKYLLFLASTDFALNTGWLDMSSFERPVRRGVYLAVLAKDEPSPLLPEPGDEPADSARPGGASSSSSSSRGKGAAGRTAGGGGAARDSAAAPVRIDFAGFSQRILSLDVPTRDYVALKAGKKGMFYYVERVPNRAAVLHRYDLSKREAIDFLPQAASEYALSADGGKLLYEGVSEQGRPNGTWSVVDATGQPPAPGKGTLGTNALRAEVDPAAEWRQIFHEAWRIERDYLYVSNLNGADWDAVGARYASFLPYVKHRADLTQLLDEMQGELSVGHSFVGGGNVPRPDALPVGLLGADFEVANGRYRIAKIYTGENWNPDLRAPLSAPGVDVREGDYILAVDGRPLTPPANPYAAFVGTVGRQVKIRVNDRPTADGSRLVTVVPIASEAGLRTRDWIEANRREVDRLSGGRLAYVYVPNTSNEGYASFNRYYFAQQEKQGAIIDERFNHGGTVADYMIDIMGRKLQGYFNQRAGSHRPVTVPGAGIWGPKVMIINEMSGSGGDMFPYLFRQEGIGPLVGERTWGGLVGWGGEPPLLDGGFISAPSTGFFNREGEWDVENIGVAPDIAVEQTPAEQLAGHDPQLERAVAEALKLLEANPMRLKAEPAAPDRVHPGGTGGTGGGRGAGGGR